MIRLALRFDGPSATSNRELEMGLVETLEEQQACASFAVIPPKHRGTWREAELAGSFPVSRLDPQAARYPVARTGRDRLLAGCTVLFNKPAYSRLERIPDLETASTVAIRLSRAGP